MGWCHCEIRGRREAVGVGAGELVERREQEWGRLEKVQTILGRAPGGKQSSGKGSPHLPQVLSQRALTPPLLQSRGTPV